MIRFYLHKNPEKMTESVWCRSVAEVNYVLKKTGQLVDKTNG